MIIDTHCHFDMMPNPERYLEEQEAMHNISIGMTNLPSHFAMGYKHVKSYRYSRLALGLHPLYASEKKSELRLFNQYVDKTSYIGEIGLDFSSEGRPTKEDQIVVLNQILHQLTGKNKIISVHSRKAEKVLIDMLCQYDILNVIFHWYSGPLELIPKIIDRGYYFSINESMTTTVNGRRIIDKIPVERILTETDAPYNKKNSIKNAIFNMGISEELICSNFKRLLSGIRK